MLRDTTKYFSCMTLYQNNVANNRLTMCSYAESTRA